MKNYKMYPKVVIGSSDYAALTVRVCESHELTEENAHKWGLYNLNFGQDGQYQAYLVDGTVEIGSHYKKVIDGVSWVKIYDDVGLTFEASGKKINIYRAAEMGCIIQIIQ